MGWRMEGGEYAFIHGCVHRWCRRPRSLVPGGPPCLRLVLHGDSFMLHQIRCCRNTAQQVTSICPCPTATLLWHPPVY